MPMPKICRRGRGAAVAASLTVALCLTALAGCVSPGRAQDVVPPRVAVDARPNGIAVRARDGAVFVTDDRGSAVLWSAHGAAYARYAAIPAVAGEPGGLSQLAFAGPDDLLVERFGFGRSGALVDVPAVGRPVVLTGTDPVRRRLGLAVIGPGRVLSSWFVKIGNQPERGGVSLVTYDPATHAATERVLIDGMAKPVGLAVRDGTVYVSDQSSGTIVRASLDALLAAPQPATAGPGYARVDGPDLLAVDGDGALYTKCNAHGFCRIAPDGTATVLADDFQDARGVAIDRTRRRLYVVDRARQGGTSYVRSFALPAGTD
ncbi:hypothetical protein CY652_17125 [Burkholderia sp. WAC0059]|uniref:hypothetical protein n=1 Tax=Burkholderia sp. WAC0059 TaxID=2066022 RepID=UPI000C7EBC86|nr:hypothetical protein [Burkholderia sp. WAC0059]PLZ01263.1 hypothetical protein CY652_17125 [Burkholderia sp. WAC0059]